MFAWTGRDKAQPTAYSPVRAPRKSAERATGIRSFVTV
jgi:hypothetical protein